MILKQYISDGVTNVLAITFLTIAFLTFGLPEYFDRLYVSYILLLAVCFIRSPNILSFLVILLCGRFIEEIIFYTVRLEYFKLSSYLASVFLLYYFWYDKLVKNVVFPTVVIVISVEIYWYFIEYPAPRIDFYIWMVWLNIFVRHLLFLRVPLVKRFFSTRVEHISIDWEIYSICKWHCLCVVAMISEYLIRHLTAANPMLVYDNYGYVIQLLSVIALYFITKFVVFERFKLKA